MKMFEKRDERFITVSPHPAGNAAETQQWPRRRHEKAAKLQVKRPVITGGSLYVSAQVLSPVKIFFDEEFWRVLDEKLNDPKWHVVVWQMSTVSWKWLKAKWE